MGVGRITEFLWRYGLMPMRCTECGRWRVLRQLESRFTPDTPFTSENMEWLCRHCYTPDGGFRSMEFFP